MDFDGMQSLIDWFLVCGLAELGENRGRGINFVQNIPPIFAVIYYLSPAMCIKAFSYSIWFCLQVYNCSCNINIPDLAKMFRTRSQNTLAHLYTSEMA